MGIFASLIKKSPGARKAFRRALESKGGDLKKFDELFPIESSKQKSIDNTKATSVQKQRPVRKKKPLLSGELAAPSVGRKTLLG